MVNMAHPTTASRLGTLRLRKASWLVAAATCRTAALTSMPARGHVANKHVAPIWASEARP